MLVFSNPVAGQEDAFNEWYDTEHLAQVTAVPGVVGGRRFDVVPASSTGGAPAHRYLAVYDLTGAPDEVVKEFVERAGSGEIGLSPALDMSTLAVSVWRPRGEPHTAE